MADTLFTQDWRKPNEMEQQLVWPKESGAHIGVVTVWSGIWTGRNGSTDILHPRNFSTPYKLIITVHVARSTDTWMHLRSRPGT